MTENVTAAWVLTVLSKIGVNKKESYDKQIPRQHSCHKNLLALGQGVGPCKNFPLIYTLSTKSKCYYFKNC